MPTKLGMIGLKGHESVVLNASKMKTVEVVAVADDNADAVKQFPPRNARQRCQDLHRLGIHGRSHRDGCLAA